LVYITEIYRDARSTKHKIRKELLGGRIVVYCYLLILPYYVLLAYYIVLGSLNCITDNIQVAEGRRYFLLEKQFGQH